MQPNKSEMVGVGYFKMLKNVKINNVSFLFKYLCKF